MDLRTKLAIGGAVAIACLPASFECGRKIGQHQCKAEVDESLATMTAMGRTAEAMDRTLVEVELWTRDCHKLVELRRDFGGVVHVAGDTARKCSRCGGP